MVINFIHIRQVAALVPKSATSLLSYMGKHASNWRHHVILTFGHCACLWCASSRSICTRNWS